MADTSFDDLGFTLITDTGTSLGTEKKKSAAKVIGITLAKNFKVNLGKDIVEKFKLEAGCKDVEAKDNEGKPKKDKNGEPKVERITTHKAKVGWLIQTETTDKKADGTPLGNKKDGELKTRKETKVRKLAIEFVSGNGSVDSAFTRSVKGLLDINRTQGKTPTFSVDMKKLIDTDKYEDIDKIFGYKYEKELIESMDWGIVLDCNQSGKRRKTQPAKKKDDQTQPTNQTQPTAGTKEAVIEE